MNFSLRNIILIVVLTLLFVAVVVQMYTMYTIANAKVYKIDATTDKVLDKGVDAQNFWTLNKSMFFYPTVGNLIGMALLGLILVMG